MRFGWIVVIFRAQGLHMACFAMCKPGLRISPPNPITLNYFHISTPFGVTHLGWRWFWSFRRYSKFGPGRPFAFRKLAFLITNSAYSRGMLGLFLSPTNVGMAARCGIFKRLRYLSYVVDRKATALYFPGGRISPSALRPSNRWSRKMDEDSPVKTGDISRDEEEPDARLCAHRQDSVSLPEKTPKLSNTTSLFEFPF